MARIDTPRNKILFVLRSMTHPRLPPDESERRPRD
jgi:hypothetical protein